MNIEYEFIVSFLRLGFIHKVDAIPKLLEFRLCPISGTTPLEGHISRLLMSYIDSTQFANEQVDNDFASLINLNWQRFQIATCKSPTNHNYGNIHPKRNVV